MVTESKKLHTHEVKNELFRVKSCPLCEERQERSRAAYKGSRQERMDLHMLDLHQRGEG